MENKYIAKLKDLINRYHIQFVHYESIEPRRFYALQNARLASESGIVFGEKLLLWIPQNTLQSQLEQTWCIAHELGHAMLMHHQTKEGDPLKKEHDAWNKAECILLAHNIPLHAPDGEWTFSESFFMEREWALGTYRDAKKKENIDTAAELVTTKSPSHVKTRIYRKIVWLKAKRLRRFLLRTAHIRFL